MPARRVRPLTAHGEVPLSGSLWSPSPDAGAVHALLVMHPGSGPSDRDNDVFFPPIREALLDAGVAVASFDKRGVGASGGSWLDIGIEEQASDLMAGLGAAVTLVPDVPAGIFGHSQGGWVVLEALRMAAAGTTTLRPTFGVMSSGPGVTTAEQERFAARQDPRALALDDAERDLARTTALGLIGLFEAGAPHEALMSWAAESSNVRGVELARRVFGAELPDPRLWDHFVRLARFDPVPAMEAIDVPLLAVFGAVDVVTPVESSVCALRTHVAPEHLEVAVLEGGDHRLRDPERAGFVPGYPDVVIEFISRVSGRGRTPDRGGRA